LRDRIRPHGFATEMTVTSTNVVTMPTELTVSSVCTVRYPPAAPGAVAVIASRTQPPTQTGV
jgi:hypothetical protein